MASCSNLPKVGQRTAKLTVEHAQRELCQDLPKDIVHLATHGVVPQKLGHVRVCVCVFFSACDSGLQMQQQN